MALYTKDFYTNEFGIHSSAYDYIQNSEQQLAKTFYEFENVAEYHQARLLNVFTDLQISQRHFSPTTGYGYNDDGRDTLDVLYSKVFQSEDALVRTHWVSGTHVLSDSLFSLLRPGDILLSITGKPYDTLNDVIGSGQSPSPGSLAEWGVKYMEVDLVDHETVNINQVKALLVHHQIRLVLIQRSRGYEWRQSLSVKEIEEIIHTIKEVSPQTMVLVDNCYGEFTEEYEPSLAGADLTVGSLIKNPGGGLAPTGAYAVGTKAAIALLSSRLTSPGIGREVGACPSGYALYYQGLFLAPHIVCQALKGAALTGYLFNGLGYKTLPGVGDPRSDIIQSIQFSSSQELIAFCQAIQAASPVDGHVVPYPWDMPGYNHQVIMAAGTFIQGASIELSADAPIKEPHTAYLQGGLTYAHVKLAMMKILTRMQKDGYIKLP